MFFFGWGNSRIKRSTFESCIILIANANSFVLSWLRTVSAFLISEYKPDENASPFEFVFLCVCCEQHVTKRKIHTLQLKSIPNIKLPQKKKRFKKATDQKETINSDSLAVNKWILSIFVSISFCLKTYNVHIHSNKCAGVRESHQHELGQLFPSEYIWIVHLVVIVSNIDELKYLCKKNVWLKKTLTRSTFLWMLLLLFDRNKE